MKKIFTYLILFIAISIHLYFYISSAFTHSLDKYFLPVTQGQDFFAIPNGARGFLNGGELTGEKHSFINCCGVNNNVYHPFFTLLIGIPVQFFKPWTAFYIWLIIHFLTDLFIAFFLVIKFKDNKYLIPALVIFLASNLSYYEIINNQFHFLVNLFTFLLLYEIYLKNDSCKSGLYYFLTLLVKPIGIFWVIPLIFGKFYKTILIALGLFIIGSLPFYFTPFGKYYFDNLSYNIINSNYANWNIFYIFSYFNIKNLPIHEIKLSMAIFLIIFCLVIRANIIKSIILWILYVLFMYQNNFPYHFSIVAVLIPLVLLFKYIKIDLILIMNMFILALPVPFMQTVSEKLIIFNPDVNTNKKLLFLIWVYSGLILFSYNFIFSIIRNKKNNYV